MQDQRMDVIATAVAATAIAEKRLMQSPAVPGVYRVFVAVFDSVRQSPELSVGTIRLSPELSVGAVRLSPERSVRIVRLSPKVFVVATHGIVLTAVDQVETRRGRRNRTIDINILVVFVFFFVMPWLPVRTEASRSILCFLLFLLFPRSLVFLVVWGRRTILRLALVLRSPVLEPDLHLNPNHRER